LPPFLLPYADFHGNSAHKRDFRPRGKRKIQVFFKKVWKNREECCIIEMRYTAQRAPFDFGTKKWAKEAFLCRSDRAGTHPPKEPVLSANSARLSPIPLTPSAKNMDLSAQTTLAEASATTFSKENPEKNQAHMRSESKNKELWKR
jgi:hypothetical protein